MEQKKNRKEKDSVRLSVTLPKKTHNYVKNLAEKNGMSIATVLNIALEYNLDNYFSNIRYIDSIQGEKIEKSALEIADNSRLILNNIKRIGINYNQELKLKMLRKNMWRLKIIKTVRSACAYVAH